MNRSTERFNFPPLGEVRENFRVKWYRCPVDPAVLRQLMKRSNLLGAVQTLGHLGLFLVTGTVSAYCFVRGYWLPFVVAMWCHGTIGTFFRGLAVHELGHGTVFKTRWLNRFFLRLLSLLSWWNHHEYAMSHTYHHRYTLHLQGDREVVLPQFTKSNPLYILQLFTFNFSGGMFAPGCIPTIKGTIETALGRYGASILSTEWSEALYTAHPEERCHAVRWARMILLFHACLLYTSPSPRDRG